MPSSTATPMLDKVRQYAKDWGIKIVGDRSGITHAGPGIFSIHWPIRKIVEIRSATLALDYYGGSYLGLEGWEKWMGSFTLAREILLDNGYTKLDAEFTADWAELDEATKERLVAKSLAVAVETGLLTAQGAPTFNRSAWMPLSMRDEQFALPLVRALAAVLVEAKR